MTDVDYPMPRQQFLQAHTITGCGYTDDYTKASGVPLYEWDTLCCGKPTAYLLTSAANGADFDCCADHIAWARTLPAIAAARDA